MKDYDVSDLLYRIRLALDESPSPLLTLPDDADNVDLDQMIRLKLLDAAQQVHMSAPAGMVDGEPLGVSPQRNQDGSGQVVLPEDFMRLVIFQMRGWKRPVTVPIGDDHPDYILQKNRYVRGGPDKPVCALTVGKDGRKVLEYYSVPDGEEHVIEKGIYLPWPQIVTSIRLNPAGGQEQTEWLALCPRLSTAVVYMSAGLVCTALGDMSRADYLMNLSKTYWL